MIGVGVALLAFATVTVLWPLLLAVPLALLSAWVALSFLVRAHELRQAGKRAEEEGRAAQQRTASAAGDKSTGK
jgi:ABC-type microcin C transport system permease subunit YejE